ncbi:glycosyltransferase WbuB [Bacillus sp. FJAT-27225]|uniref:glycosyltransferase family 4 protein n=1 Tax=Bacillus sp. FJAT-27225 TaxID=1743144 RepID=UPI00080C3187|nr:glycosyltransferase WbuB [Bacillus sp. FJAT-27225]
MKIWILNHAALKPGESGITRHYDLASVMVEKGHEVTIFASSFIPYFFKWRNPAKKNYNENVNGVLFEWLWTMPYKGNSPMRLLNMISYFFMSIYRGLQKRKEKPDVIVGSSVHLFACLAGYYLSRFLKTRYIVEIRDLWPRTLIDFGAITERHPLAILFGAIEKFVYKKADQIIVTLPGAADYIEGCGVDRTKIVYIPNGVHMSRLDEFTIESSLSDEFEAIKSKHKRIAVYVGAHGTANALETVIASADYLNPDKVAMVFIGEGPEKQKLIDRAKPYSNVYFFNSIPKEEVLSTLRLADILMVSMLDTPLYKYGISLNKLNDYLLAGKPAIFAGNVLNNIIENAKAGITVPPENPEKFAEGIKQLLQLNQDEIDSIKVSSFEYVNKHHNIEKLAEEFLKACTK